MFRSDYRADSNASESQGPVTSTEDTTHYDDSSSGSSLDEEEIREVVRQVMTMVKQNRRSQSHSSISADSLARATYSRQASVDAPQFSRRPSTPRQPAQSPPQAAEVRTQRTNSGESRQLKSASCQYFASKIGLVAAAVQEQEPSQPPVLKNQEAFHHDPLASTPSMKAVSAIRFGAKANKAQTGTPSKAHALTSMGSSPSGSSQGCGGQHSRESLSTSAEGINESGDVMPIDEYHLSLERRRVERMQKQRQEHLRDETFTPRIYQADPNELPKKLQNIPLRSPGRWEDRLYHEYLSKKKQQELYYEALRIAQQTQKEVLETLEECTFQPNTRCIHEQLKGLKRGTVGLRSLSQEGRAGAVAVNSAVVSAAAAERLFGLSQRAPERDVLERRNIAEHRKEERKKKIRAAATANETQVRLYEEDFVRTRRLQKKQEDDRKRMIPDRFVFKIKGQYYETLPIPTKSDPHAFERLYTEVYRRQEATEKARLEAQHRRPSPQPKITDYAKRMCSSQPVVERLTKRTQSPLQRQLSGAQPHLVIDHHLPTSNSTRDYVLNWIGKTSCSSSAPISRQSSLMREHPRPHPTSPRVPKEDDNDLTDNGAVSAVPPPALCPVKSNVSAGEFSPMHIPTDRCANRAVDIGGVPSNPRALYLEDAEAVSSSESASDDDMALLVEQ